MLINFGKASGKDRGAWRLRGIVSLFVVILMVVGGLSAMGQQAFGDSGSLQNPLGYSTGFYVVDSVPRDGEVYSGDHISVTFSQPVLAQTVNESTFVVTDNSNQAVHGDFAYNDDYTTVTFTPQEMANVFYQCKLTTGIRSTTQAPLDNDYIFSFQTDHALSGYLLYQLYKDRNIVSVIDPKTYVALADIPVGNSPLALAVYDEGKRAIVVCEYDTNASILDLENNILLYNITIPTSSRDVYVDSVTGKAYISSTFDGITIVNLLNNTVEGTISDFNLPVGLTVINGNLYAGTYDVEDWNVTVIDLSTKTVTGKIPVGECPEVLKTGSDGKLWILNTLTNNVTVINPVTMARRDIQVGMYPMDVEFAGGKAFIANAGDSTVSVVDLDSMVVIKTVGVGSLPVSLSSGPAKQYVLVADAGDNAITYISVASLGVVSTRLMLYENPSELMFNPCYITINSCGQVKDIPQVSSDALIYVHHVMSQDGTNAIYQGTSISHNNTAVFDPANNTWNYRFNITSIAMGRTLPLDHHGIRFLDGQLIKVTSPDPTTNASIAFSADDASIGAWPYTGTPADYSQAYWPAHATIVGMQNTYSGLFFEVTASDFTKSLTSGSNYAESTDTSLAAYWSYTGPKNPGYGVYDAGDWLSFRAFNRVNGTSAINVHTTTLDTDGKNLVDTLQITLHGIGDPRYMGPSERNKYGISNEGGIWVSHNPLINIGEV